ncbi:MAG: deoxyribodipyrimidine photolyase [Thermoplasmatota archaeon]
MHERVRVLNDRKLGEGPVVYWSTSARRSTWNPALDHAIRIANEHDRPLLVFEALRCDAPYTSRRFHAFVQQGMQARAAEFEKAGITYHAFLETEPGAGKPWLADLAKRAGLIVADDHPGFFYPRMLAAAAKLPVRVEAVDGVGLLPLSIGKAFPSAYVFRRFVQKELPQRLASPEPLDVPEGYDWDGPHNPDVDLASLPIDGPDPVATRGDAGPRVVQDAIDGVERYPERNQPDANAQTGLSPYLHFGHVSAVEVVHGILEAADWHPGMLGQAKGQREGFWGLEPGAEALLDQVITWRELGHMEARHNPAWNRYPGLPEWARTTLEQHDGDRTAPYDLATLEAAQTDDEIWNAAQRELLESGRIHNYLRMLWGKKILEWAPSARDALRWMLHLNDTYALDGRDPNSVSGIFWCLGRYDRPWQERDVFGKVRCMTSDSTRRKLRLTGYLKQWSPATPEGPA